jgi:glycosyltransferase involved in cell wall biosynthesis
MEPMKILFITRSTLFTNKGGDTMQILNTQNFLRAEGVDADIKLCHENIDYTPYDLLHFFNIIRPADILRHSESSGKPFVISTIYVDYSEYDREQRGGLSGFLFKVLPAGSIEYMKVIARALVNGEKIVSKEYLWKGQTGSVKKLIREAALLLPNSNNEYQRLLNDFKIKAPYRVIPNAIDPELFALHEEEEKDPLMVLCVGRIEGIKNQLALVRALSGSAFQLYLIGNAATNQQDYYQECKKSAGGNIHFIDGLPQSELLRYYSKAKVHVLPSWFETTGLSSLEAAAMGCNVVITEKGDAKEYFGPLAFYCDPASPQSIRKAVEKAASAPVDPALRKKILTNYTWQITAAETAAAYRYVLSKGKS